MSERRETLKNYLTLPVIKTLDKQAIEHNIPHREPFLLVDEVRVLEEKKKYIGVRRVRADEYYFKGHFPQKPIMPGVLVVESISQAFGGAIMGYITQGGGGLPLFLSIDEAKFRGMVVPGDLLEMPIEIIRFGKISKIYAEAYVNGKLCTQASLTFILGETPHA
ncbi:3-hydroxyacyl-ACP dehydratase FabZ [Candidatus Avelusimicrobium faecicola]|uniref:3-hydroxyacyl-ACP dehydratase FabZ n=1 Tax=Candidatus Avelusimicrobium faecicola TaxID=3416205 RepID=UPI00159F8A13|nr:3-hydroxyacyl-ACP dehydratase FabZ [Spirochaetota bacterium]MDE3276948.1 3-hydroxyacyl-ACP dehydratase FabZ [Spirochaetota bacterium]MDY2939524.1 3-hydroxyacyl-ACP dehydratase FabZ [Elusimicrobiaceae bacterium]MDY6128703.1 3-hydroxyacyl-ACP dehydratase FabZ [Elusimicrobiaceae bacterium]